MNSVTAAVGVDPSTETTKPASPEIEELRRKYAELKRVMEERAREAASQPLPAAQPRPDPAPDPAPAPRIVKDGPATYPNPIIPATDDYLREKCEKCGITQRLKYAFQTYSPDHYYRPTTEILRGYWNRANEDCAPLQYDSAFAQENTHPVNVAVRYDEIIGEGQEFTAQEIIRNSPEQVAAREAARLRKEQLEKELEENMALWKVNRRRRRQHDMGVPRSRPDVATLCYQAEDYHWEFFEQFFSKEYCGYNVEYDPIWKGYRFPKEAGDLPKLLFSTTGSLFDSLDGGVTKGELIPEWNYVTTYGSFVCGYKLNSRNRFSPNNYARAVSGFDAWLKNEKEKKEGTIVEYGSFKYWQNLLGRVVLSVFENKMEEDPPCTLRDSPRNFYNVVAGYWPEEQRLPYSELTNPTAFTAFLRACLPGGEHHDRSQRYFKIEDVGRKKVERFQLTFNPACIQTPVTPEEEEAMLDHVFNLGIEAGVVSPPTEIDMKAQLDIWAAEAKRKFDEDGYIWDDNARAEARAEAEQESQNY